MCVFHQSFRETSNSARSCSVTKRNSMLMYIRGSYCKNKHRAGPDLNAGILNKYNHGEEFV